MNRIGPLVMEIEYPTYFVGMQSRILSQDKCIERAILVGWCELDKTSELLYLRDQWSDSVHILQSCSADEYFETAEYEAQTPTGVRVNMIFLKLPDFRRLVRLLSKSYFFKFHASSSTSSELTYLENCPNPFGFSAVVGSIHIDNRKNTISVRMRLSATVDNLSVFSDEFLPGFPTTFLDRVTWSCL